MTAETEKLQKMAAPDDETGDTSHNPMENLRTLQGATFQHTLGVKWGDIAFSGHTTNTEGVTWINTTITFIVI